MRFAARAVSFTLVLAALFASLSCSRLAGSAKKRFSAFAVRKADKAAYEIIQAKQKKALGKPADFSIESRPGEQIERLLSDAARLDLSQDSYSTPTCLIGLSDALAVAVSNNRDYLSRKEELFSDALSLTEVRRDFATLFSADASLGAERQKSEDAAGDDQVEWFGTRGLSAGASRLLAAGGRVTLDYSNNFVRFFTNEPNPNSSNGLTFAITQPLLRGAGTLVASEGLVQGERNMIYSIRRFRRYQQDFIIRAAEEYYSLLAAADQLRNARFNYMSAVDNHGKLERLAAGGKASDIEVDQARQKVFEAEAGLSRVRRNYGRLLDNFKVFLGLPIDMDVGPDPEELERLADRGLLQPDMTLGDAIRIALEKRLDYKNQKDQVEDSRRFVRIALRNFLPNLSLDYQFTTSNEDEGDKFKLDFGNYTHAWSINLGLPFDWTPRRNDYRRALIASEQSRRALDLFHDQLVLEVRDAWRELEESRVNYRIQVESVRLAERRVTSTSRFLQRGRASARDLLEAEDALLASRNGLTAALVQHTLQRMRFWNVIERLEIDSKGMWTDQPNAVNGGSQEPNSEDKS